ncbi:hypothetical protein [Methylobacterium pseudosasicola]|uniref:Uncharacterized protein n=1 Tax=Methylobacterium pseudosasicola TaxID=582667 RepID=A0A1I4NKZ4_9HYPH|nr:hypothetical protein [Methylobacterium pseudosasicola]SFM16202.1 hypothetical protein SAMN05192568_102148 [Methylobacterium pseudosasicola]
MPQTTETLPEQTLTEILLDTLLAVVEAENAELRELPEPESVIAFPTIF